MPEWMPIAVVVTVVALAALAGIAASRMANRRSAIGIFDARPSVGPTAPPSDEPPGESVPSGGGREPGAFSPEADQLGRLVGISNTSGETLRDVGVTAMDNYGGRASASAVELGPGERLVLDLPGWDDHVNRVRKVWLQKTLDEDGNVQPAGQRPAEYRATATVSYRTGEGDPAGATLEHRVTNRVRMGVLVREER